MESELTSTSSVRVGPVPLLPPSTASEFERPTKSRRIGAALFLDLLVSNNVPIITTWPVELLSMRDLGKGGSYTVCSGNLVEDLDVPSSWVIRPDNRGSKSCAKGTSVAVKTMNHQFLESVTSDSVDLAALATEVSILSNFWIRACPQIVNMFGVGWARNPYDEAEATRYWPYILTEFGNHGTLEDYFRLFHRTRVPPTEPITRIMEEQTLPTLPSTKGAVSADWKSHVPWDLKLLLAFAVAQGLRFLHCGGVVHGDVKFANTVAKSVIGKPDSHEVKLCDFGSSILISDYEDAESGCFLIARTEPWDAPESKKLIKRDDLYSTDIYSFGLLFSRIMLDGNDPFDESFHIGSGNKAVYDITEINRLKESDEIVSHIQQRLLKMDIFSPEQMDVIMAILRVTLAYEVGRRVKCIGLIAELLFALLADGRTAEVAKPDLGSMFGKCTHEDCISKKERLVKRDCSIPDLLQGELHSLLIHTPEVIEEVYLDIRKISEGVIANPAPQEKGYQAIFQLAMCHIHGWGTICSPEESLKQLIFAGLLGSEEAMKGILPMANAIGMSLPERINQAILTRMEELYPSSNNRIIAEVILEMDPKAYLSGLTKTRTKHLDLITNQRYRYSNKYAENGTIDMKLNREPLMTFETEMTDLHYACAAGNIDEAQTLILSGEIDINARTGYGHTPLWLACNCGHANVAHALLDAGADPSIGDVKQGVTPIHFLARFDPKEIPAIASSLVSHGGDVNANSRMPESPLEYIFDAGRNFCAGSVEPAVLALLDHGASPFGDLTLQDIETETFFPGPLLRAMWSNNAEAFLAIWHRMSVIEYQKSFPASKLEELFEIARAKCFMVVGIKHTWFRIVESGEDYYSNLQKILTHILTPGAQKHFKRITGKSVLSLACKMGQDIFEVVMRERLYDAKDCLDPKLLEPLFTRRKVQAVIRLVQVGMDLSISTEGGDNFLHLAAKSAWTVEHLDAVCSLMPDTVDLRKLVNTPNSQQETPFDIAVMEGHLHLAEFLHSLGPDIDVERPSGTNANIGWAKPFAFTLFGKCLATEAEVPLKLRRVRYMLKFNPKLVVSSGIMRWTAFHVIFWMPWSQQRKRHISPEATDVFSNDILNLLLDHYPGPEAINKKDALGVSPLHMAASSGNKLGVKRLLDRGAFVNALDNGNNTPQDHVGDELYKLAFAAKQESFNKDEFQENENLFIFHSRMEVYILLEVMELLEKRGGLPGVTCLAQGASKVKLDAHSAAVERVYREAVREKLKKRTASIESKVGEVLTFGLIPPNERKDLTGHFFKLTVDDPNPDHDEYGNSSLRDDWYEATKTLIAIRKISGPVSKEKVQETTITLGLLDEALQQPETFDRLQNTFIEKFVMEPGKIYSKSERDIIRCGLTAANLRTLLIDLFDLTEAEASPA